MPKERKRSNKVTDTNKTLFFNFVYFGYLYDLVEFNVENLVELRFTNTIPRSIKTYKQSIREK